MEKYICPICGELKDIKSFNCLKCEKEKRIQNGISHRENKYNITREELKKKIRITSFLQIGKEYGISDKAIRKWCKAYNLPFKTREIKSYSDEEWEKL